MFEAYVLHLLQKYLGEYVHGLSAEALRVSVWKGDVVLKNLKLKAEALNLLKLPITVKAGFVGSIRLKVPWKNLGKEPVIVLIDHVFVLANPVPDGWTLKEEDKEKLFEVKLRQIEEAESATLEANARSKQENPPVGNSWLGSLIATIIGNLRISIGNVHIRYEDSISNPGHPFSSGITLAKLAAVTMDEQGNETFDTSGVLDKLRKSLQLERLAVYHDSDILPWEINKKWEDLSPEEWIEIFGDGIKEVASERGTVSVWARDRKYMVSPINGVLKYYRLGEEEIKEPETPLEKASLVVSDVSLMITEAQYCDVIKLVEVISRYKSHVDVSHLTPCVSVSENPRVWWCYAAQASLHKKRMCYQFSWDRIHYLCQLRRRYIQLYAGSLQQLSNIDHSEMRSIEKDLDSKVILLWRLLAHAKVESVRLKEAAQRRSQMKRSWLSFGWGSSSEDTSHATCPEESQLMEERLTKEEWQAINKLLSYQPDEALASHSREDGKNIMRFLVNVSIGQAAARIIDIYQTEIICGRFEELNVSTKIYSRSTHVDVSLRFYGLSAPEGSLAKSFSSEKKVNALAASFVHSPVEENVDWLLSAKISPCHVTVLMKSCDRFLEFLRRSKAVSPTVALETAAALQMNLEKVTRRAQEQFQMVLEQQSRFALDIDFDAPKVIVPLRTCSSIKCDGHFLLDFGHFTLHSKSDQCDEQRQSLYSRFYISGQDIATCFMDCGLDHGKCTLVASTFGGQLSGSSTSKHNDNFLPLVDRCGMAVIFDQIKIPHPSYPSTRVSVQVPVLGIHFSPARYFRIFELLNIVGSMLENKGQNTSENSQLGLPPWSPADLGTEAKILVWRGLGNSVAEWQPCFVVLSGLYLYVLDSEVSQSYRRCVSMAGRQLYEVPPASIGGSRFSVAVAFRRVDFLKALESSSTMILEFADEEVKATWLRGLTRATYRASAPPSFDVLEETSNDVNELSEPLPTNLRTADLVIDGMVVETKLQIYGKAGGKHTDQGKEKLILEIIAGGGKVHIVHWGGDLSVKTKLHSFQIKDELQGCLSTSPQYLVRSVLKDDKVVVSPTVNDNEKESSTVLLEEDDIFKDALSDFSCIRDHVCYSDTKLDTLDGGDRCGWVDSFEALVQDTASKRKEVLHDIFYEAEGNGTSDFVVVNFSRIDIGSPIYDGIDTQMSIRMSKLEFFCNRPTLVALIDFGLDLSSLGSVVSCTEEKDIPSVEASKNRETTEENARSSVKGLLGYGKGRIVFHINMDVDSVSVFLNKEDGSQLAMFVQESFLLDLKVHPSSFSIDGTLGNFKLCDMSLGADHQWGWLCDIRNEGVESLIKFSFNSYSAEDDDHEGYDYSLFGHLSAVRIVFLYKFVQEITSYFMELATPHSEEAIKLVDKVGGIEWLIQKDEMDGAAALKLDLSLDTPIIIIPRDSKSKDFLQLELGKLRIINELSWHGFPDNDPSAVHLDVLHAEIVGINVAVGIDSHIGKPMIQKAQGLHLYVRRSLRDVFRKVPTFSVEVKVGSLHVVMSDKEYGVILDCAYMNISEEPKLPPSFRNNISDPNDAIRMLADKVNINSQIFLSRTVTVAAVEVNSALLELCSCIDEESPLAHISVEGLWVSYRMTSLSETDFYVTIPVFSIVDSRLDTRPEMRLMLGSSSSASGQCHPVSLTKSASVRMNSEDTSDIGFPNSTMLLMDYRVRSSCSSFVVRVQQPRVLVVLDFLLAVGEFFVPSLRSITGKEEMLDPKNDPITRKNCILLSSSMYKQREDVLYLSSDRQLIADARGVDEYIYDGCGGTICLSEEVDVKETPASRCLPIIVVGCGKNLRFMNVKIENAALLRKYVYLDGNSSYSVSVEDGVDLLFSENLSSGRRGESMDHLHGSVVASSGPVAHNNSNRWMQNFTFEAQVVSPEFTFYDSTKSFLDDSLHGEKFLRAKMDLSFIYASKETDTWIGTLVKDLTIEAGSGLIILDPVDISGAYTSVKEKTNISVILTDVCIHLSLSVISLVIKLQNQAVAALRYGNADPLASCTHFDRLWTSSKGNGPGYNLTFWRPRAPSNYVILGDCVTSRPIPPSQAVMAVGNTYGRVRKALGFKLIGSFTDIYGFGGDKAQSDDIGDCSIWLPIAPPGYIALGCVAHLGDQPPPTHIVYCIRCDLVSNTEYSECIFSIPSNPRFSSGFSIWCLDNVVGSFFAHLASERPSNSGCEVAHLLLRNSKWFSSSLENSASAGGDNQGHGGLQGSKESASSSGWDIVRSVSRSSNCYMSTPHFERIWWDKGDDLRRAFAIWRPIPHPGYAILGDCVTEGLEPPALGIIFKDDNPKISAKPMTFTKVAHIATKGLDEAFFWYPNAPPGYISLGCVVSRIDKPPPISSFCCPRMDLVNQANIREVPISTSSSFNGSHSWSIWKVENQAYTFLAHSDLKRPSRHLAYSIGDPVKPKTQENISGEMKLRYFSLTVVNSLCGMMTPLFDTTVTNINLATHGRLEEMSAVLISSIAASTFNTQLEAWEPLVEPFDGIFKYETYNTSLDIKSRVGKRVHVAATSIVNVNISAANVDTFADTLVSWRKQTELEEKSVKVNEDTSSHLKDGVDSAFSALDEDFQTMVIENRLGCDIYLKKVEQKSETLELLHHEDSISAWMPPPRFSDRLNVATDSREACCYVAIQIYEARGLPIVDDGNSHNFFCALRLVDSLENDQQKLFSQSARTKCVKPSISKSNILNAGTAKWNELFIFQVPRKGLANLEVEVTNLAAKAGKGEIVGESSIPVGLDVNMLKKVTSFRTLHQPSDGPKLASYPLTIKGQLQTEEGTSSCGCLLVSTCPFEKKTVENLHWEMESVKKTNRDSGLLVGLGPEGPWESLQSLLPLSVTPKKFKEDFIALQVVMKNGKKHAILRGLATAINDSDVKLDISVCPLPMLHKSALSASESSSYTVIGPGSSTILPWRSMAKDSDLCLLVRPFAEHPQSLYSWGHAVAVGSGYAYENSQALVDRGSLSRQDTMNSRNMNSAFTFRLNQLEKKDILLNCSPGNSTKKNCWLSIGTDATVLHTELNAPVYDWKISITSPLKLENRLPCPAEFTIWERTKEGSSAKKQHGIITSRESVHIYSADIRKPIYLSLFVQGGWVLEKDPILILDLASLDHVSSFWMVHQQSKRKLRVSIEHNMGGTGAAPKTVRFFVPYWISNDSSLPLAYRMVEIEATDNTQPDSLLLPEAVKSAKMALRSPIMRNVSSNTSRRRNIQVLEEIEDTSPTPVMLSPQNYVGRGGVLPFQSRNDASLSPRVGIAIAIFHSEHYTPGIALLELENKGRVDVKAFASDGSYYKLSAMLKMTSDRTKVVHFQPETVFINRVGQSIALQQCETRPVKLIHPNDPPTQFQWQSMANSELLKMCVEGYKWSTPFSIGSEGVMCVSMKNDKGSHQMYVRVEVKNGLTHSHYEVVFCPASLSSPYRIENRSMFLPIRFRQADGTSDSWHCLLPNSAASFAWEDLGRQRLLEVMIDGADPSKSQKYNIDEVADHLPIHVAGGEPTSALRITVLKQEKMNVIKISDWMPENGLTAVMLRSSPLSLSHTSQKDLQHQQSQAEFHVIVELAELGLSVIDHTPEEILYVSVQNLILSHSTGLGSGISRFKLRMNSIQVDNQLPLTPMPVVFRPQKVGQVDYILKLSMTAQLNGSPDLCIYPYIGFYVPENSVFLINIHEPIIWRLHDMIQRANLSRFHDSQTTTVSVDPIIQIGVLNISEIQSKVSMAMSPTQRPTGVLGFWLSLMTALGNIENMTVRINQRFHEGASMRQSALISTAISNIQKDLLSQPLRLLSGVDILGNASSALGNMSKGVAALSMDTKFIQNRQRQKSKGVEDIGDVIREGGGALAKGLFRGVTGILTKPLEGAKSSGMEGFVQGVGKGIIGAAAQPVSGVLDLLSKTTEGANAMRMKIISAITSEEQLLRRRLPRVISGDNLLRPYDEYRAQGQVILQLAESGALFGQVDLFKVRGKFALSDAYEDHFLLPRGEILVVTHRRVILLQKPSYIMAQRKFSPARDRCSVLWDVLWDNLVTVEITYGKKDHPSSPPSMLILYLQARSMEMKDHTRVIECSNGTQQALEIYSSIEQARNTYGPNQSGAMKKSKVTKPYSPSTHGTAEVLPKGGAFLWSNSQQDSTLVSLSPTFGSKTP